MRENPLTAEILKSELNKNLGKNLIDFGLNNYDGNYLWYSDFDKKGIRKVFKYQRLKGESGTFNWGYSLHFIPTITNAKTIKFHRTVKSIHLHLFDEPINFINYSGTHYTKFRDKGMVSQWGFTEFNQTFYDLWNDCIHSINNWFLKNIEFQDLLDIIHFQQDFGSRYKWGHGNQNYIKSFILEKIGKKEDAISLMNSIKEEYVGYDIKWESPYNKIIEMLRK